MIVGGNEDAKSIHYFNLPRKIYSIYKSYKNTCLSFKIQIYFKYLAGLLVLSGLDPEDLTLIADFRVISLADLTGYIRSCHGGFYTSYLELSLFVAVELARRLGSGSYSVNDGK